MGSPFVAFNPLFNRDFSGDCLNYCLFQCLAKFFHNIYAEFTIERQISAQDFILKQFGKSRYCI